MVSAPLPSPAPEPISSKPLQPAIYKKSLISSGGQVTQQGVHVLRQQTRSLEVYEQKKQELAEAEKNLKVLMGVMKKIDKTTNSPEHDKKLAKKVYEATKKTFSENQKMLGIFSRSQVDHGQLKQAIEGILKNQSAYVSALKESVSNLQSPSEEDREIVASVKVAQTYTKVPEVANLKPGEFVTLSRKGVQQQTGHPDLPRSVDIIRTSDPACPFIFLVHQHSKTLEGKLASGASKELTKGGLNRILKGEIEEGHFAQGQLPVIRRVATDKAADPSTVTARRQRETERALGGAARTEKAIATAAPLQRRETKAEKRAIKGGRGAIYGQLQNEVKFLVDGDRISKQELDEFKRINKPNIRQIKPLPFTQKWANFCRNECLGFAAMHQQGIFHMDGGQKNIGIDLEGNPVVRDFDTCLHFLAPIDDELFNLQILGTPAWFPPEMGAAFFPIKDPDGKHELNHLERMVKSEGSDPKFRMQNYCRNLEDAQNRFKAGNPQEGDLALQMNFYQKVDCYIEASNLYLKMTGSLPPFTQQVIAEGGMAFKHITRFHAGQASMRTAMDQALTEANSRGWPKELTDLVKRGLSAVPDDRPSMKAMAAAFERYVPID
ncbi:MAG: hypothetical protein LLG04_04620 [Parachlamydia sp.]|nr:hypothetical protein [Parachlamydia sp.]